MNDNRRDRDCTWERRQTWGLGDNQGSEPSWELNVEGDPIFEHQFEILKSGDLSWWRKIFDRFNEPNE